MIITKATKHMILKLEAEGMKAREIGRRLNLKKSNGKTRKKNVDQSRKSKFVVKKILLLLVVLMNMNVKTG